MKSVATSSRIKKMRDIWMTMIENSFELERSIRSMRKKKGKLGKDYKTIQEHIERLDEYKKSIQDYDKKIMEESYEYNRFSIEELISHNDNSSSVHVGEELRNKDPDKPLFVFRHNDILFRLNQNH
jgi:hypothetical protein